MKHGYVLEVRLRRQPGISIPEPADGCLLTFPTWEAADAYRRLVKIPDAKIVSYETEAA